MNINPTLKDGGFWTASTSAKGIQELEFGKYQPNYWGVNKWKIVMEDMLF